MNSKAIAKAVRVVTAPPVLITCTLLLFWLFGIGVFRNAAELLLAIFFLGVMPSIAYPAQKAIPKLRERGRDGQRKLAFVCSLVGYVLGAAVGAAGFATPKMMFVYLSYFLSVLVLAFVNKVLHEKASGHACSTTGSLFFAVFYIGGAAAFPCIFLFVAMAWSSVKLKRHTPRNIATGAAVFAVSAVVAGLVLGVL